MKRMAHYISYLQKYLKIYITINVMGLKSFYIGCKGISRSDFRYDPEKKQLYLLEINTQPGMTDTSLSPRTINALLKILAFNK